MSKKIKIGDYVSFEYDAPKLLYRVLDVKKIVNHTYILYYNYEYKDTFWERTNHVEHVFEVKEKE